MELSLQTIPTKQFHVWKMPFLKMGFLNFRKTDTGVC